MRLSKVEKGNLARFGCFLRLPEDTFYLEWSWPQLKAAHDACVSVRFIPGPEDCSPLLCVAFEVSPIRFLPRYSFCPLDLRKERHKGVLNSIRQKGMLNVCFVQQGRSLRRTLTLPKTQVLRLADLYKASLNQVRDSGKKDFNFARALREFERSERAPQHFSFFFSEAELERFWPEVLKNLAARAGASKHQQFVTEVYEVLRKNFDQSFVVKIFDEYATMLQGVHFPYDLYWALGREPDRLKLFLSDLASGISLDVEKFAWVPQDLDPICNLLAKLEGVPAERTWEFTKAIAKSVAEFARKLTEEGHLSRKGFLESLARLKPWLTAKPGRPHVDYSLARKLKREDKLSWSRVAEKIFDDSAALQTEFGKSRFIDLSLEDRSRLIQRIRHGVRRAEKPQEPKPN